MWTSRRDVCLFLLLLVDANDGSISSNRFVEGNLSRLPNVTEINTLNKRVEAKYKIPVLPTESPTESPAPSPSPSEAPSNDPERITEAPSAFPTESPAPSPSPSEVPTIMPTESPSSTPSATPSVSPAPSLTPSAAPSDMPSDTPSMAPSSGPSASAMPSNQPSSSLAPSVAPSSAPSAGPSSNPSSSPTYSPTKETQKTKSSISEIVLLNIPRRMDDMTLARFEIATLEFIRQAKPPTKDFDLEFLAVTVLTQDIVFPDRYEVKLPNKTKSKEENNRSLSEIPGSNASPWDVALEVSIRVVGAVTSGRVPTDFELEDLAMYGFENHFNQYLWQLGNSNEFFAPLKEISDWPKQQQEALTGKSKGKESKKATFVMAILFSLLALGIAFFASFHAIRRQMRKKRRYGRRSRGGNRKSISPKPKLLEYSGPDVVNYLTNSTNEDSTYHDGDVEGGGAIHFSKSVDLDDQSLESVGLTPRAAKSPASRASGFFSGGDTSPLKSPVTLRSTLKEKDAAPAIAFGLGGAQKTLKKWMTPRQSVERTPNVEESKNRFSIGSKSVRFDPPEKEIATNRRTPREQSEPEANTGGIYVAKEGMEIVKSKTGEDGDFTLPISFFTGAGDDTERDFMDDGTPMSSLAGSNGSSFFSNIGKSFAGRRSSTGIPPSLNGIPTNPTIRENYAFSVSSAKSDSAPSTVVNESRQNGGVHGMRQISNVPKKKGPASEVSHASQASRVQEVVAQIQKRHMEAQKVLSPHPVPPRKPFANPHEGFESILGARSRSMEEDDVVQNMLPCGRNENQPMKAPSCTPKSRITYGYGFKHDPISNVQKTETKAASTSLGARPIGDNHHDDMNNAAHKSTLSDAMQRPGTYDVYAPEGPIGIVVDTSKDGPSVHSLKSTSPMLGLITAGDLIIALDNEDTRNLSAAELTRLMAKKSRQRERKITLYSVDGF